MPTMRDMSLKLRPKMITTARHWTMVVAGVLGPLQNIVKGARAVFGFFVGVLPLERSVIVVVCYRSVLGEQIVFNGARGSRFIPCDLSEALPAHS